MKLLKTHKIGLNFVKIFEILNILNEINRASNLNSIFIYIFLKNIEKEVYIVVPRTPYQFNLNLYVSRSTGESYKEL